MLGADLKHLSIHLISNPTPHVLSPKRTTPCYPTSHLACCRIIDIRPTKSLGLILDIMHQINLRINIDVKSQDFWEDSARKRVRSRSCAAWVQGRRPLVGHSALTSSGRYALFFYCRPQPESQQKLGESSPPLSPLLPLPPTTSRHLPYHVTPPHHIFYNFLFDVTVPSNIHFQRRRKCC